MDWVVHVEDTTDEVVEACTEFVEEVVDCQGMSATRPFARSVMPFFTGDMSATNSLSGSH